MASQNKHGKNPETGSEQIAILITPSKDEQQSSIQKGSQKLQNISHPSPEISILSPNSPSSVSESPLTRSRLGESSVDSEFVKELLSKQSEPQRPHSDGGLSKEEEEEEEEEEEKEEKEKQLDEFDIYKTVSEQLKAKRFKRTAVKLVLELPVFLVILGLLICSFTVDGFKDKKLEGVQSWKWYLLLMVIFSGLLLTRWIVRLIVFLIEWNLLAKKNVVYFTHGLKNSVQVFVWLGAVLCTWVLLFRPDIKKTKKSKKAIDFITWTLVSLFIGSFIWLVKTTLIKLLASSFHNNRFLDKIQESVFYHDVLQILQGRPYMEMNGKKDGHGGGKKSFKRVNGSEKAKIKVDWEKLHRMQKEKEPSWKTKFFADMSSNFRLKTMSGLLEKPVVEGNVELDDDKVTSKEEAIATAVGIFLNILRYSKPDKSDTRRNEEQDPKDKYIVEEDLLQFLIPKVVDLVYPMFEVVNDGHITVKSFCNWVVQIDKDRKALQHALNDNKTAVKQFNHMLNGIIVVIIMVLWLLLTEIASTKILLFLSSQLVVAAFIFGNTCKTIFEAVIFVFVMHPFDVGDRCLIDGTMMVVEEMSIFTTVFLKNDNEKVYYPNSVLATKAISNYYRSPDQWDSLEFAIDYSTSEETINKLKDLIKQYLNNNQSLWKMDYSLVVKDIENLNKIKMALYFSHTMNFQDIGEKSRRRSELVLAMKSILDKLKIKYHLLPQEIHVRNLTSQ